ncbi:MAG TPA: class I SAM-dependent methyltransferase [Acidimicrobiales bacterium]|nr:class I SAM-dependent methyltransferase [Acidimicrobiales bacterium]
MSRLASVLETVIGADAPLAYAAYDGSTAGQRDDPVGRITVRDRRAFSHMIQAPGELGLARAYVSGALDLEGDLHDTMVLLARETVGGLTWAERLVVLQSVLAMAGPAVLLPTPPPPEEVRPGPLWGGWSGLRHTLGRDARAISHHYDVSNRFYEWILGPTMAYTCAVYPTADATLEQAQIEKVDLVCRKLGLRAGQRLLDVGCGWGTMVRHAASEYGAEVLGVTLSAQQAAWGQAMLARDGLTGRAEIRHADYRSVAEGDFDAISSIGLTEHIGRAQLPAYAAFLASRLKPRGRLLNHCITRPESGGTSVRDKGFINRYVFPDGELEGVGEIVSVLQNAGLEIRHEENLREHYARTCTTWAANLEAHWREAVAEVGEGRARVWRLYLTGSALGFEQRRIELHQVLAVKTEGGQAAMPLRPDFTRRATVS